AGGVRPCCARNGRHPAYGRRPPVACKEPPGCAGGPMVRYLVGARALAVLRQELHHVVKTEATVAPLADAEERQLAAVAQALDGVDVQMKQVRYFTCRQHRP